MWIYGMWLYNTVKQTFQELVGVFCHSSFELLAIFDPRVATFLSWEILRIIARKRTTRSSALLKTIGPRKPKVQPTQCGPKAYDMRGLPYLLNPRTVTYIQDHLIQVFATIAYTP